jgi:hypothetical protein
MYIIPKKINAVNENIANVFPLEVKDRALQGCNLSVTSSPPGESTLAFFVSGDLSNQGDPLSKDSSWGVISEKPNQQNLDNACLEDRALSLHGSDSVPTGLDGLNSTNCDKVDITGICKDFDEYIDKLEHSEKLIAHIKNEGQGLEALVVIDRMSGSRYFPEGRAKIRRKIQKRIKPQKEKGIYGVFTVDTKLYSMIEAWDCIWENFKLWRDAINVYRKRHMGVKESLRYVAVLEQHESGYPHLNVFFPGLRILIKPKDFYKITEWWKMGGLNGVEMKWERKAQSVCSYVLKYVSKMEGWTDESFAILWHYRIRLWNMSHCWYNEKKDSGWVLFNMYRSSDIEYLASLFDKEADKDARFVQIKKVIDSS